MAKDHGPSARSQMWSHSRPSGSVQQRPARHFPGRSRTVAAIGERRSAMLENVLGATPREFESRILREPLTRQYTRPGHMFGLGLQGCVVSFVVSFILRISCKNAQRPGP